MTGSLLTVTNYGKGAGSARARVFEWLDYFALSARSITYLNTANASLGTITRHPMRAMVAETRLRALAARGHPGTLLLSRHASPFSNGRLEARLLERAGRGIYDVDDALFHSGARGPGGIWSKARVWDRAVAAADVVIVGNEYLAERAAAVAHEVTIIPTCVAPAAYPQKAGYGIGDVPRAVWIGTPSTERLLVSISKPLLALHAQTGLRLNVISAGSRPLGPLDPMVDRMAWHAETAAAALASADFGVMPLTDTPWNRGKCAYKLLQYGAAGLPLIADPIGANARVLSLADGLAPRTIDEWHEALNELINEPASRREARGRQARAAVEEHYSFAAWADRWRQAVIPEG